MGEKLNVFFVGNSTIFYVKEKEEILNVRGKKKEENCNAASFSVYVYFDDEGVRGDFRTLPSAVSVGASTQ